MKIYLLRAYRGIVGWTTDRKWATEWANQSSGRGWTSVKEMPGQRSAPWADQTASTLDGYWAVYLLNAINPDQPIAIFQYPDHARRWAEDVRNYKGRRIGYMRWPDKPSNASPNGSNPVFGVLLINGDGSQSGHSQRWGKWDDAAKFGEREVKAKRAKGFRVFETNG